MIEVYTAPTPNGRRVTMLLELCGVPYIRHDVDLGRAEHKSGSVAALNATHEIPVMVDRDEPDGKEVVLSQSGAICLYIAEKIGMFIPQSPSRRIEASQWFWHAVTDMGGMAAMIYRCNAQGEGETRACIAQQDRFVRHAVLIDRRLEGREFLAEELSIADIALLPVFLSDTVKPLLAREGELQNVVRWYDNLMRNEAIARGL